MTTERYYLINSLYLVKGARAAVGCLAISMAENPRLLLR